MVLEPAELLTAERVADDRAVPAALMEQFVILNDFFVCLAQCLWCGVVAPAAAKGDHVRWVQAQSFYRIVLCHLHDRLDRGQTFEVLFH